MPAYVIALISVNDQEKYQEYGKLAAPAVAKYGGKYLARGGVAATLEGKLPFGRVVIVEFADAEAAKRFYHSPEYQAARQKRLGAAEFTMVVCEGL